MTITFADYVPGVAVTPLASFYAEMTHDARAIRHAKGVGERRHSAMSDGEENAAGTMKVSGGAHTLMCPCPANACVTEVKW